MNTVYVGGYWKSIYDLTFQQVRELLDDAEADLRAKGATEVFINGVDGEDGALYLQGQREQTPEEVANMERIAAQSKDAAVKRYIEYIEQTTGKEVKLV